ncbi:MAG: hypothetical protein ABR874_18295 [Candidatus Sulfotelmatobacter sp.]
MSSGPASSGGDSCRWAEACATIATARDTATPTSATPLVTAGIDRIVTGM